MKLSQAKDQLFNPSPVKPRCRIMVLGVGGAGGNSVARMAGLWSDGPEVAVLNTDAQALAACGLPRSIVLGPKATQGMGTAGDVEAGRLAAQESLEAFRSLVNGVDLLIFACGMGGGTGTGATPVLVQAAKQLGALTLCFATMPFPFEGDRRRRVAEEGLRTLQRTADTVVCLPNDRLLQSLEAETGLEETFHKSDEVVASGIIALWQVLANTGIINLDFADVRTLAEKSGGICSFGYGEGTGTARASVALRNLLDSPLLEKGRLITESSAMLVNITGGPDMTLSEVQGIMGALTSKVRNSAHIFMGAVTNPRWANRVALTVLCSDNWIEGRAPGLEAEPPAVEPEEEEVPPEERAQDDETPSRKSTKSGIIVEQQTLRFAQAGKGRFEKVEPTFYRGEDLDLPTYLRRGIKLSFEQ